MADTEQFFSESLPNKLASPRLELETGVFEFHIAGAGVWTLDLDQRTVTEGPYDGIPGCKIKTDRATWEEMLDTPSKTRQYLMMGKLKASNVAMAAKLQLIVG